MQANQLPVGALHSARAFPVLDLVLKVVGSLSQQDRKCASQCLFKIDTNWEAILGETVHLFRFSQPVFCKQPVNRLSQATGMKRMRLD